MKTLTASESSTAKRSVHDSSYADGTPLHRVQFLEAKLILKPEHFTSVQERTRGSTRRGN